MASPVLISYLALDSDNDPVFDTSQSLTNVNAVAQVVLTSLRLLLGEWWENLNVGTPVFQVILGQLGTQQGQRAMDLALRRRIQGCPYVTSVGSVNFSFTDGQFSFTAEFFTVFGAASISGGPGLSASISQ